MDVIHWKVSDGAVRMVLHGIWKLGGTATIVRPNLGRAFLIFAGNEKHNKACLGGNRLRGRDCYVVR
ncbi:MAG: hypothetical protein K2I10_04490 [Lachnospiraceae bacterium]|nr:hypothetical protein [Lachnospiraceae bacterium]